MILTSCADEQEGKKECFDGLDCIYIVEFGRKWNIWISTCQSTPGVLISHIVFINIYVVFR